MSKVCVILIVGFFIISHYSIACATCGSDCAQYCGSSGSHGYCTDYIEHTLGARQSGDGGSWSGNITSDKVQSGDVAIFDFGSYGHVAVVDSVSGDDITISEWNYGNTMIDANCAVTNEYKETATRSITKDTVSRFWRPNYDPQTEKEVNTTAYANSGHLAWLPLGVECRNATKWIDIDTGSVVADKSIQSVIGTVVCEDYNIYPSCSM